MSTRDPARTFLVRGSLATQESPPQLALDNDFAHDFTIKPGPTVAGGVARAGAAEEIPVAHDAVCELELEDGIRLWVSGERLHETLEPIQKTRGGIDVMLPQLRFASPSRGPGRWALRAVRIFGVDIAADAAAAEIVSRVEGKLDLGLHRCTSPASGFGAHIMAPADIRADAPLLLLLHGTGSSTAGSFGGLVQANGGTPWQRLVHRYGPNIATLEHRTLTVSPIHNALEIARVLPPRARLHLLSHSRGGLVGELLSRAHVDGEPFSPAIITLLRDSGRTTDADELAELNELLRAKRPRIERFVRVACPARGTTLASGRLDLYLSLVLNALRLVPVIGPNPVTGLLSAAVLTVAKKRTKPDELPGLEAMMPNSPLIAALNDPQVTHDGDLTVVAGDIQGSGVAGRLKVLASDLFYRENHDLVVNSSSMVGGTRRGSARMLFVKGAEVSHFQYFRNPATSDRLVAALENGTAPGFEPITETTSDELRTRAPISAGSNRPLVFLLPGIMGSHLTASGDRIWLDPFDIAKGEFGRLSVDAGEVHAQAIMGQAYGKISTFLSASYDVVEFPYDWRRSVQEAANRLAQAVELVLNANERRVVRILAHSMGGLVARTMIALHPELWARITAREGGRLVMLGTPNGGSWVIPRVLLEQEEVVKQLATIDLKHNQRELLGYISNFPGMLEMLPHNHAQDFFTNERWDAIRERCGDLFVLPPTARLEEAGKLQALLRSAVDPEHMVYVCGRAPATPLDYEFVGDSGRMRVRFLATPEGDGRVLWSTGVLPGVPTWYMDAVHGDMANHRPAFAAVRELLEHGATTLLPAQPPVARGTVEPFELAPAVPVEYPSAGDLEAAALGGSPQPLAPAAEPELPLTVGVVHGNLSFSRLPVAVGHYEKDVIVAAEGVLDRQFGGALSELRSLGRYAGPHGSARVLLRSDATPPGAIIVGLGAIGSLTPVTLEDCFRHAMLEYANRVAEEIGAEAADVPRSLSVTSLIIGSGRGGISTTDAVHAIVAGMVSARRALHGTSVGKRVSLDRLEFCELYQDIAIQAIRALYALSDDARFAPRVTVQEEIGEGQGGRRRASFEQDADWWDRMLVSENPDGDLRFQSLTDRARSEALVLDVNRHTLDLFVTDAMTTTEDNPAIARTLFSLLLPRGIREHAPRRGRVVLVLNEGAARYPWELLRDSPEGGTEPLAVQQPLIRQLETSVFEERPENAMMDSALVIGDPPTGWAVPLPGARAEATVVASTLRAADFRLTHLDRPDARAVISNLLAQPYRVLHIAAHGAYQHKLADGRVITGVVLSDGATIGPPEIAAMHPVPDLVFLNCCHTGFISADQGTIHSTDFPRLAANVATQLIRSGVRAVVAAGWAVQDDAALTFARVFYERILNGARFGDAVHAARRETYLAHPAYNTWGAYQCYGDPDFSLVRQRDYAAPPPRRYACVAELVVEIENLTSDARSARPADTEALRARLETLKQGVPEGWRARGDVLGVLALAEAALAPAVVADAPPPVVRKAKAAAPKRR